MGYLVRISFLGYNLKSYPDYHKISYNILSYPIISFHILSYPKISSGANSQMGRPPLSPLLPSSPLHAPSPLLRSQPRPIRPGLIRLPARPPLGVGWGGTPRPSRPHSSAVT